MKESFLGLKKNYRIRKSFFVFIFQFIFSQIFFLGLFFVFDALSASRTPIMILYVLNVLVVIFLFIRWHRDYYVIGPEAISHTKGIFLGQTQTFDLKSIRSVKVIQPFFGLIFAYGNIVLESPLLKKDVQIKTVQKPYRHAKIIEGQRLKLIKGKESITPVV